MTDTIAPSIYGNTGVLASLRAFILSVLPIPAGYTAPVQVIQGLQNRVAMPAQPYFVVITPLFTSRLEWNLRAYLDTYTDAGGTAAITQQTQIDVQIDCYGPSAGDWATMLSTLLFDEVACDALTPTCQPLYVEGPRLMPWVDGEAQYETRYTLTVALQYSAVTTIPQQFASVVNADLIDVDVVYPPT
jgi:hypothetical protein